MIQGWHHEDYFILCENQAEADHFTERYDISTYLPGHTFVGLKGWDDFIVLDASGHVYTVPTVPMASEELCAFALDIASATLRPDSNLSDKIKWYVQPIIFGGDPDEGQNMTWVTIDQHIDLVKWWNNKFRELQ
jgi:hypothetical protein